MKEYAVSLVAVTALISLSLVVFYKDGKNSGAVRCALAVLLLYVTVVPLLNGAVRFDPEKLKFDGDTYGASEAGAVDEVAEAAFCNGIRLFLADGFSLDADDICVSVHGFDKGQMRAEKIVVTLSGSAAYADHRAMRERIEKNGMGSCEVKIEG